ncbi:DNA polymerase [Trichonephila clavipes]|nr:DNA polymerase [Trichonephila clavipes]
MEDHLSLSSRGWILWVYIIQEAHYKCRDAKKYSIYRKTKHLSDYKSKSCVAVHVLQKYPEKANDFIEYTYSRADVAQREASKWVMDAQECQWVNYEQLFISQKKMFCMLLNMAFWKLPEVPLNMCDMVLNTQRWKQFVQAELLFWHKTRAQGEPRKGFKCLMLVQSETYALKNIPTPKPKLKRLNTNCDIPKAHQTHQNDYQESSDQNCFEIHICVSLLSHHVQDSQQHHTYQISNGRSDKENSITYPKLLSFDPIRFYCFSCTIYVVQCSVTHLIHDITLYHNGYNQHHQDGTNDYGFDSKFHDSCFLLLKQEYGSPRFDSYNWSGFEPTVHTFGTGLCGCDGL